MERESSVTKKKLRGGVGGREQRDKAGMRAIVCLQPEASHDRLCSVARVCTHARGDSTIDVRL